MAISKKRGHISTSACSFFIVKTNSTKFIDICVLLLDFSLIGRQFRNNIWIDKINIWRNLWMGVFCGNLVNKLGWKCVGQYQRWHSQIHICNQFKLVENSNAYFRRFCLSYWGPFRYSCTQSLLVIWLSNLLTLAYWMKVIPETCAH